jgi:hypothetical protein
MSDDSTPYQEVLNDYAAGLNYEFGNVFYRDRVARNFVLGLRVVEAGETYFERHKELPKIARWVNNYSKRLRLA